MKDIDLRGKDYLTIAEAAHFCGVSESQFREKAPRYGLTPRKFMGKVLYRRADLKEAIESAWRQSENAGKHGIFVGRKMAILAKSH